MMKFRIFATYTPRGGLNEKYPCLDKYKYKKDGPYDFVTLTSLDKLIELMEDLDEPIIISHGQYTDDEPEIEIYDGYRE